MGRRNPSPRRSRDAGRITPDDGRTASCDALARFLCLAAHEMRAPLQTIHGFARLLDPGLAPAEFAHYLSLLQQDTDRLMAIVDDLGWRGKLASGALQFKPESCAVEPLLLALAREVERDHPDRFVELAYSELPPVHADPDRLRDILHILLRNAARYSPPGCRPLRLACKVLPVQRCLMVTVRDLGVRILERYGETIFEPMAKLPRYLNRPEYGLGLGLYVAREFARRMNGDLWLRSPGQNGKWPSGRTSRGNEFVLRLPLAAEEVIHG